MDHAKLPQGLSMEGNLEKNWEKFKQQFEIYIKASGKEKKDSDVKVAILLNIIGEEGIEIFNNFKLTDTEKKDYTKVVGEFEEYLKPKYNEVYERYIFYKTGQAEGQSIDQFVQELSRKAKTFNSTRKKTTC